MCRGFNDCVTGQTITDAPELGTVLRSFAGKGYHVDIVEDAASDTLRPGNSFVSELWELNYGSATQSRRHSGERG